MKIKVKYIKSSFNVAENIAIKEGAIWDAINLLKKNGYTVTKVS